MSFNKIAARKAHAKVRIAERRMQVSAMYVKGMSQQQIANSLGVSLQTINKDLDELVAEWKAIALRDVDLRKAEEIAKLNHLESVAWSAWEASRRGGRSTKTKVERKPNKFDEDDPKARPKMKVSSIAEEDYEEGDRPGDPRFLAQVERCIEMRLKLMGAFDGLGQTFNQLVINWQDLFKIRDEAAKGFPKPDPNKPVMLIDMKEIKDEPTNENDPTRHGLIDEDEIERLSEMIDDVTEEDYT